MQRVDLLEAAKAALSKNASALQKRAISSRVSRTSGLVKDRITYELDAIDEEIAARVAAGMLIDPKTPSRPAPKTIIGAQG
jgi:hypothetical protein